jgi:hypothetical protein
MNSTLQRIALWATLCCVVLSNATQTDLVIFSFNRPLQLYAFLESIEKYVTGINHAAVIYRADDAYEVGYQLVKERFGEVTYLRQGSNPRADFKPLTLDASFNQSNVPYIIYGVDDIVVKDYVDLNDCARLLEQHQAYAFYLRLGRNLTYCYSLNQQQPLPPLTEVEAGVFRWTFRQGAGDWGYPHSVDMTLLRKADLYHSYNSMHYSAPNILEGQWSMYANSIMHRQGLCYDQSKIVNFPLNRVQNDCHNRHMNSYSASELLDIFLAGQKMDSAPIFQMNNSGAHTEYEPTFIER